MKNKLVKSAAILTSAVLLSKLIGSIYRIPLSNILGAEGVGMYQLVFSVYALIVTIIGSGLPIAVSRLTAETISRGESDKNIFIPSIMLGLIFGLFFSIIVLFLSKVLAKSQGNEVVSVGYLVISPAIFFVSGLSVLKGYFQGKVNMLPTSISYIIEQIVKLIIGLSLASFLSSKGTIYAVIGSLIGVTISELIAFLVLLFIYLKNNDRTIKLTYNIKKSTLNLIKLALPITIGSMLIPLSQFLDSFIVVNLLSSSLTKAEATAMYGLYSGSVNPIVNMPVMLVLSLAMIIVPVVSKDRVSRDYNSILSKSKLSVKVCFIVGIPCSVLLFVFSRALLNFVYPKFSASEIDVASSLLRIASFSVVFYGTMQIETSLMQGLDKIFIPIKNLILALIIKEIFVVSLVNTLGIKGLSIATLIMSIVSCLLNSISYHRLLGSRFKVSDSLVYSVTSNYVFFSIVLFCKYFIFNDIVGFLVASIVGGSIYYKLIRYNNVLTIHELQSIGFSFYKNFNLRDRFIRGNYDYSYRSR